MQFVRRARLRPGFLAHRLRSRRRIEAAEVVGTGDVGPATAEHGLRRPPEARRRGTYGRALRGSWRVSGDAASRARRCAGCRPRAPLPGRLRGHRCPSLRAGSSQGLVHQRISGTCARRRCSRGRRPGLGNTVASRSSDFMRCSCEENLHVLEARQRERGHSRSSASIAEHRRVEQRSYRAQRAPPWPNAGGSARRRRAEAVAGRQRQDDGVLPRPAAPEVELAWCRRLRARPCAMVDAAAVRRKLRFSCEPPDSSKKRSIASFAARRQQVER